MSFLQKTTTNGYFKLYEFCDASYGEIPLAIGAKSFQ